ncbi:MAG: TRAP transporter permease [Chromatiales bacterium]|nr:TRAP transporter permease [Chromatiales bacterium]
MPHPTATAITAFRTARMATNDANELDALQAAEAEHGHHHRLLDGINGKAVALIALSFSVYQMYMAAFSPLSSQVMRSIHVGFLLLLAFALFPPTRRGSLTRTPWYDWLLAFGAFGLSLYHWIFEVELLQRSGDPTTTDLVVGTVMVLLVFEAARRIMGLALPIICALFVAYALFGEYLPDVLMHRGYGYDQVVSQMFLGTEGIFGIPTLVSATYIFLFILFGAFLEQAGVSRLFTDIALGMVGRSRGGAAKVSVVSSALMGSINGSGVANVVTTGQFTIPLMKRYGYQPAFAGAVEATASMGGQILPPVMGAVAFIMAETLDLPYVAVVKAAIVPALLYFATVLWIVHLEAGRLKLSGLSDDECPSALAALRQRGHLLLPLVILVYLILAGYTPMFAGMAALAFTAVLILGFTVGSRFGALGMRIAFWIVIGIVSASFFDYGIVPVLMVIALLSGLCLWLKGGRETLHVMYMGLVEGAKSAVGVGVACAIVGTIIGTLTLTGLASSLASSIIALAAHSLFLSLFLTMLVCLVLGMGIPTIPNYIITSSIAGPALLELGVPLIVSHMFVFYFGIMADLTPPVALAAFAASPIARAPALRIGVNCLRIAIAGFVIPFMAVYSPALMLQSDDPVAIAFIVFKALLAIALWGAAAIGFLFARLNWPERLVAAAGAFSLVVALPVTDGIGFAICALFLFWHLWRVRGMRTRERGT